MLSNLIYWVKGWNKQDKITNKNISCKQNKCMFCFFLKLGITFCWMNPIVWSHHMIVLNQSGSGKKVLETMIYSCNLLTAILSFYVLKGLFVQERSSEKESNAYHGEQCKITKR